jgi:hypothetical protein
MTISLFEAMTDGQNQERTNIQPKRGWGGSRPGAGRKPGPKPYVSREDLLKIVHKTSAPAAVTILFVEAAAGDINALRRLLELYSQAEKIGHENFKSRADVAGGSSPETLGKP